MKYEKYISSHTGKEIDNAVDKVKNLEGTIQEGIDSINELVDQKIEQLENISQAESINYDNSSSGLSSENLQDAVDEVEGKITDLAQEVGDGFPESGEVITLDLTKTNNYAINLDGKIWNSSEYVGKLQCYTTEIKKGQVVNITGNSTKGAYYALLKDATYVSMGDVSYMSGCSLQQLSTEESSGDVVAQEDGYLYIFITSWSGDDWKPSLATITTPDGYISLTKKLKEEITKTESLSEKVATNTGTITEVKNSVGEGFYGRIEKTETIKMTSGFNIRLADLSVGSTFDEETQREVSSYYEYAIVDVEEGDKVHIECIGGNNPRAYALIKNDSTIAYIADASATIDKTITIEEGIAKVVINNNQYSPNTNTSTHTYYIIGSVTITEKIESCEEGISEAEESAVEKYNRLLEQTSNIVNLLGLSYFKGKTLDIIKPDKYSAWPFVGIVSDRIICVYTKSSQHTDNTTPSIYSCYSFNGVIWSEPICVIDNENTRDTITGKGQNSNGDMLVWNRVGSPDDASSFDLYKTSDGITYTKVCSISQPSGYKIGHIGDIISVENAGLMAFFNTFGDSRSWGIITSSDDGLTWNIKVIESGLATNVCPTEISATYIGSGKILAIGRRDEVGSPNVMMQIESSDYGSNFTRTNTNIDDISKSTPSIILDNETVLLYYVYRESPLSILKYRTAKAEEIFGNPSGWSESVEICNMENETSIDAGNVNSVLYDEIKILSFYAGKSTSTGIYSVIM